MTEKLQTVAQRVSHNGEKAKVGRYTGNTSMRESTTSSQIERKRAHTFARIRPIEDRILLFHLFKAEVRKIVRIS